MPLPITDNDLLARYLRGDIDARQESELERRAAADPDLRAAMDGLQTDPEHDHAGSVRAMLAKARRAEGKAVPRPIMKVAPRRLPRYWWAAAAGLLIVFGALFLLPNALDQSVGEVAQAEKVVVPTAAPAPPAAPATSTEGDGLADDAGTESLMEPIAPPSPRPTSPAPAAAPAARRAKTNVPPLVAEPEPVAEDVTADEDLAEEMIVEEVAAEAELLTIEEVAPAPQLPPAPAASQETARREVLLGERRRQSSRKETTADRTATGAAARYLSGVVTDANGEPVAAAQIDVPGNPIGYTTDSSGFFRLDLDATLSGFTVTAPGFETEAIDLQLRDGGPLQITLETVEKLSAADFETGAISAIDLDAITGGRLLQEKSGYARPENGYRVLKDDINLNRPEDVPAGKVKVNFLVNPNGSLTDFNFNKKTPPATAEYVRSFLMDNGNWEVVRGEEAVRVYFKVRLR
ncbi:carboxypeptidase-like regulatory domain-containing protein [Lewinella sp. 4G2]|uniref:carboxypeptidase-like regulatory domain-containing protein n=1 Tax=Lewinella sp. 4G2 TaxID=1803372 RepID=UPI0007B4C667|nr:carboxypeptidase-like regulatory domain-containing protein [Lewinella sp. 4G2]OAV43984.1 hypothetical protein A3850_005515 [Lewinella sp. 4G2]